MSECAFLGQRLSGLKSVEAEIQTTQTKSLEDIRKQGTTSNYYNILIYRIWDFL